MVSNNWLDDILGQDAETRDDSAPDLYCPYTNGAVCALLLKGWEPQELCKAMECSQMRVLRRKYARPRKAA